MVRTKLTARKSTAARPSRIGRTDDFYKFKMGARQNIDQFLDTFYRKWWAVGSLGVSELDGVLQLMQALPPRWRGWASEVALDFVHPDMEVRTTGNLFGFINLVREQFHISSIPPASQCISPTRFIAAVHQTLDDILAPKEISTEPENLESEVENSVVDSVVHFDDFFNPSPDRIESTLTSLDMDLYDQPFALKTPSPPVIPLSSSEMVSTLSSVPDVSDLDGQFSVGTSTLQPISTQEMPSVSGLAGGTSREPAQPIADPPTVSDESDPETPEGYWD